jgi:hypothetical protein
MVQLEKGHGLYFQFVRYSTQGPGQARAQLVLHDGRRDGNAPDAAYRPDQVDGRRRDGVICSQSAMVSHHLAMILDIPPWSNAAIKLNRIAGYTMPCPRLAGNTNT